MGHWVFWEWVAYAALFIAALFIAADTGVRLAPSLGPHMPSFLHSAWWGFAPLALILLATGLLVSKEIGWLSSNPKTEEITRRHFDGDIITLDNKVFYDCTFKNVTFRYSGGPWRVVNSKFEGTTRIETQNGTVQGTIDTLKFFGFLSKEFSDSWNALPSDHFGKH